MGNSQNLTGTNDRELRSIRTNPVHTPEFCSSDVRRAKEKPGALAGATGPIGFRTNSAVEATSEHAPKQPPRACDMADFDRQRWGWARSVRADGRLSDGAKLLAQVLITEVWLRRTGLCRRLKVAEMAEMMCCSERTMQRRLAELTNAGWITRHHTGREACASLIVFTEGDGTVPYQSIEKVVSMNDHQPASRAADNEMRGKISTPHAPRETSELTRRGDKTVTPSYLKEPKNNQTARATGGRETDQGETEQALASKPQASSPPRWPVPHYRCVPIGSVAEREWDAWLTARRYPRLIELGIRCDQGSVLGWQMPWMYPPNAGEPKNIEIAEKCVNWAICRMTERQRRQNARLHNTRGAA